MGFVIIMTLITVPYVVRPGVGVVKQGRTIGSRQATQAMYEDYRERLGYMDHLAENDQLPRDPALQKVRGAVLSSLETLHGDRCNEKLRKRYVRAVSELLKIHPLPGRGIPRSSTIEVYEWEGRRYGATKYLNDLVILRIIRADSIFYLDGKDFSKQQRLLAKNSPRHIRYQRECGREVYESRWKMVINELVDSYWQMPTLQPMGNIQDYSLFSARFKPLSHVAAEVTHTERGDSDAEDSHETPMERLYRSYGDNNVDKNDYHEDYILNSDQTDESIPSDY